MSEKDRPGFDLAITKPDTTELDRGKIELGKGLITSGLVEEKWISDVVRRLGASAGESEKDLKNSAEDLALFLGESLAEAIEKGEGGNAQITFDDQKGVLHLAIPLAITKGVEPVIMAISFPVTAADLSVYQKAAADYRQNKAREAEQEKIDAENRKRALPKIKELILKKTGRGFLEEELYEFSPDDIKGIEDELKAFLPDSWIEPAKSEEGLLSVEILDNETRIRFALWSVSVENGEIQKSIINAEEIKV